MSDYYDRDLKPMDDYSNKKTEWGGRRVLQTTVAGYRVSTVWLSLDHSFDGGAPIVFESMVWEAPDGEPGAEAYSTRHYSEEGAARWHLRALDAIRSGAEPSYDNEEWMEGA